MANTIERLATCARQLLDAGAEIARRRAALKPFAAQAYDRDHLPPDWVIGAALSDLRAARAALGQQ